MEFKEFRHILIKHFEQMTKDATHLFEADVDKDELWNLYLDSYPNGTNLIFRTNREYDCSCCKNFIKNIGNAVIIKDNKIETIWDINLGDDKYQVVADALAAFIKSKPISSVYISKTSKVGTEYNFEENEDKTMIRWEHFFLNVPEKFVADGKSANSIKSTYNDTKAVFKRSLEEISEDSLCTVLELISQNSLYKGKEWKHMLTEFLIYKTEYEKLSSDSEKDLYLWEKSAKAGIAVGRIRNHSIGTLLINISEGMDLDIAVKKYEQIVAPTNYMRPKPIFTKKMLEEARQTITELGYLETLNRRFAKLDDININNILFSNKDSSKRIVGTNDIFGEMEKEIVINPKKFSRVEEVSAGDFINNILPAAKEVEVFFEGRHAPNMVSLIAPLNPECKNMFKWNNGFSWAYTGNITDSDIKERVKAAGGNINGILRFSIQWNEDYYNPNDFDAHCIEPGGNEIFYKNKVNPYTTGNLDVDIINPVPKNPAVENITWYDDKKMKTGTYKFFVHCYTNRGGRDGFKAEVEFNGQIYSFEYKKELKQDEIVQVAEVTLNSDGSFAIKELLPSNVFAKDIWNVKTYQFVPVCVICYSPNYWDEQSGIGHRHLFFMLKDCINPEAPNGFYNEFLKDNLLKHKKVFECLGSKCHVENCDDQLSGIGFSMSKRNDIFVKVKGSTERVIKVKF